MGNKRKNYSNKKTKKLFKFIFLLVFLIFILDNEFNFTQKYFINKNTNENIVDDLSNESQEEFENEFSVHFIDVGQGDATLFLYDEFTMLIDTGDTFAENDLMTYLEKMNVQNIDIFIGTHPHSDHIGNVKAVYDKYEVVKTIIPNAVHTTKTFEEMIAAIENEKTEVVEAKAGYSETIGDLSIEILSPLRDSYTDLNDYSVVTKIKYKDISLLFTGDATTLVEQDILDSGANLNVDILKVPHHGSDSSSKKLFISSTLADYGVISVGVDNDYGHPKESVLETLDENNIEILRTDKSGTIIFSTDGIKYSIKNDR
ncbi:MAG: ComEC/Rec2 family competence protein [Lachnospirales bacterium]